MGVKFKGGTGSVRSAVELESLYPITNLRQVRTTRRSSLPKILPIPISPVKPVN